MIEERIQFDSKKIIITLICAAIIVFFWFLTPTEPLTAIGMKVIGSFIGVILLLSLVDTVWPAILGLVLLSSTGVANLNAVIAGSLGNWIVYFVMLSFIMAYALEESGFTGRLVTKFMSMKFVNRGPWIFMFSVGALGMILSTFMDQIAVIVFMMPFVKKIYKELGCEKGEMYPSTLNIITIFSCLIGGIMTPISHSLVILPLGIYEAATGNTINLFTYTLFGVPTGLVLFVVMALLIRIVARPEFDKFKGFDVQKVLDKQEKMTLKELLVVIIFFFTAFMWMLPGVLTIIAPQSEFVKTFSSYGITFWAIISVSLMAVLTVNKKPLVNLKDAVNKINWSMMLFLSISLYLASAISAESTGVNAFVAKLIEPVTQSFEPMIIVFIVSAAAMLLTNFSSNISTTTIFATLVVTVAGAVAAIPAPALLMVTTFGCNLSFTAPSGSTPLAILHGDEYSISREIYKCGIVSLLAAIIIVTFVGYYIATSLV